MLSSPSLSLVTDWHSVYCHYLCHCQHGDILSTESVEQNRLTAWHWAFLVPSSTSTFSRNSQPTCICCLFPAVMFDIVQQASFLMDSLGADSKCRRQGRAPQLMMTWVWMSSPVTMLPTARSAADTTLYYRWKGQTRSICTMYYVLLCYNSKISKVHAPLLAKNWICFDSSFRFAPCQSGGLFLTGPKPGASVISKTLDATSERVSFLTPQHSTRWQHRLKQPVLSEIQFILGPSFL